LTKNSNQNPIILTALLLVVNYFAN